jgi:hypothetical protein
MSILDTFITNIPIAERKRDLFLLPLVNHDLGNIVYEGDIELGKLFFVTSINLLPPYNASEGCINYCDADDIANLCQDCEAKYIDGSLVKVQALLPVAMFDSDNMENIDLLIGQLDVFRGFIVLNTVDICPPAKLSQIFNHYNNLLAQGLVPKYSIMGLVAKGDFKKLPDFVKKSTRLVYRETSLFNDKEIAALRSFYDENYDISEVTVDEFHAARIEAIKLAKASQWYSNIEISDQLDSLINSKVKNTHNVDKLEYAEDIYKLAVGTYVALEGRDTPTSTDVDEILPLVLPKSYTAAAKPESASPFARKLGGGGIALPKRPVMGASTTQPAQGNGGKVSMQGPKAGINKPSATTTTPKMGATPPAAKQPIMPKQPAPQPITRTPPQQQATPKAAPAATTTDIRSSRPLTASHPAQEIIENPPYEGSDGLAPIDEADTQGSPSIVKQSIAKKSQLPADIADIIQGAKKPAPEEAPKEEKTAAKAKLPIDIDELIGKSKKEKPPAEAEAPKAASAKPVIDMDKILAKGKKQPEGSEAPKAAPAKASDIDMDKILAKGKKSSSEETGAPKAEPAKSSAIDMDKILAMGKKSHEEIEPKQVENDFDKILANIEHKQENAPAAPTPTPKAPPTVNPIIEELLKKGPNSLEANIPANVIDSKSSFVFNPNAAAIKTEAELQEERVAAAAGKTKPSLVEEIQPDLAPEPHAPKVEPPKEEPVFTPPEPTPAPKVEPPKEEPVFTAEVPKAPPEPRIPKTTVRPTKTMTIFFGFDISKNSWSAEIIGSFCEMLNNNDLIYPIDIGVIVFNDKDSQVLLNKTSNYAQVVDALESIVLRGKSNLADGLNLGEQAVKDYMAKNNTELVSFVVLTDGKSAYSNMAGKSGTELAKNFAHNIFNSGINCWLMDFDNGFLRFGFAEEIAKIAKCRYTLVPSNEYTALLDKINGILSFYKEKYQIK